VRRSGVAPRSSIVAGATLLAIATFALRADAHGSRLVPIEEKPPVSPPAALPAGAAPRPPGAHDWTGLHLGGHLAYDLAKARSTLLAPGSVESSGALGSLFGGVQVGYDHVLPSRILLGVEGDISFPHFVDDGAVTSLPTPRGAVTDKVDFVSTLRGRAGYAMDSWLLYATGGLAWSQARLHEDSSTSTGEADLLRVRTGWAAGAGAELAIGRAWSLRLEYQLDHLGGVAGAFASGTSYQSTGMDIQGIQLGLQWHFGGGDELSAAPDTAWWPIDSRDWNVHGQLTFVEQGYFGFRSPYQGPNSLSGSTQFQDTVSATAFLGLRLWEGGEVYVDPEIDQGFGLSQTLGVAGFPNGEAQKASYPDPRLNVDRLFLRQTFGLGGEQTTVEDGPNRLPATYDVSRLTVTVGRLSVGDAFLLNTYASDPRTQFLNWNIYGGGSYDWTMDRPGWTWGAIVDFNQPSWALRAGYFLENTVSNGNSYDLEIPTHGQYTVEPELRYSLLTRPGKLRLFGWVSRANMGSYADAVAMPLTTPGYPDITQTRQVRTNYGFVANVEQSITDDLGVFSRASYSPGLVEVMGWTDCDESVSLGTVLRGTAYRRPDDAIGVAGVVEGLSPEARSYFAAGGTGIVIGDGRLDYRPEEILEAYYAFGIARWVTLTLDYQLVANPGYNADRGPVSIYAARLHAEL